MRANLLRSSMAVASMTGGGGGSSNPSSAEPSPRLQRPHSGRWRTRCGRPGRCRCFGRFARRNSTAVSRSAAMPAAAAESPSGARFSIARYPCRRRPDSSASGDLPHDPADRGGRLRPGDIGLVDARHALLETGPVLCSMEGCSPVASPALRSASSAQPGNADWVRTVAGSMPMTPAIPVTSSPASAAG